MRLPFAEQEQARSRIERESVNDLVRVAHRRVDGLNFVALSPWVGNG